MFACLSNEQYLTWNVALREKSGVVRGVAKGCVIFEKVALGPARVNEVNNVDLNKTLSIEDGVLSCRIDVTDDDTTLHELLKKPLMQSVRLLLR